MEKKTAVKLFEQKQGARWLSNVKNRFLPEKDLMRQDSRNACIPGLLNLIQIDKLCISLFS